MGIRRVESEARPLEPVGNPLKRVANFDDSSIRKMLRSAYTDFVGEELELQMNQNASSDGTQNEFHCRQGMGRSEPIAEPGRAKAILGYVHPEADLYF